MARSSQRSTKKGGVTKAGATTAKKSPPPKKKGATVKEVTREPIQRGTTAAATSTPSVANDGNVTVAIEACKQ